MTEVKKEGRARRIAAGTLVGLGVLGLGMAAASQLGMSWEGNFQAGNVVVDADCQTSGAVDVSYDEPKFQGAGDIPWGIENVQFSKIDAACEGLNYESAYKIGDGDWVVLDTGTVAGTVVTDSLASAGDVQKITDFALTIYSENN